MVRRPLAAALTAALMGSGLFLAAAPVAEAAPVAHSAAATVAKPRVFKTCADMNKVYKHGVGRSGAKDKSKGKLLPKGKAVTNFRVDTALYNANKARDGDKDGIACEKK